MSRLVFVLCEDRQQEVFIRCWLNSIGFRTHDIRVIPLPAGKGAGAQHVQSNYHIQVKTLRQVNSHDEIGRTLITAIDADTFSIQERFNALDNSLSQDGQEQRNQNEKIAILVPKRNIETWIHYVQGVAVDEDTIYHKLAKESDCKAHVARFAGLPSDSPLKTAAPPSLQQALAEMERIV